MYKSRKKWPRTIGEAVDKLLKLMSEDDKKSLKNSPEIRTASRNKRCFDFSLDSRIYDPLDNYFV